MQINRPPLQWLSVLMALMLSMMAQADDGLDSLAKRLKDRYPATRIERVQTSEIPALFEVTMGKNTAYTDVTGRYFIFGHLFDMKTQRDLTAERMEKQQRIDFGQLPVANKAKCGFRCSGACSLHRIVTQRINLCVSVCAKNNKSGTLCGFVKAI